MFGSNGTDKIPIQIYKFLEDITWRLSKILRYVLVIELFGHWEIFKYNNISVLKYVALLGDEFDVPSAVEILIENKYNIWYN